MLDAGIVVELDDTDRESLLRLFTAIVKGDGLEAGRLMLSRARRQECSDPGAFCSSVAELVDKARGQNGLTLSAVQVGELLGNILSLCCTHRVLLEANFASVVTSIAVLEGLGRHLDPELDILAEAAPIVLRQSLSWK